MSNFPDPTLGRLLSKNFIFKGILKEANLVAKNECRSSEVRLESSLKKIAAHNTSPSLSSDIPNATAYKISLCSYIAASTSGQAIFSPPLITISLTLSRIYKKGPSNFPKSPDLNQPSSLIHSFVASGFFQ